ncbi:MAG: PTS sugar transporter subunit IIB [Deltaproteobacteria bacterium]|jgi:mannose/fructose/N-acetylgalactosamine-specific phosphotransferase system component IIB|nr:PTS sugar transporter subunit IIB [Deltaproteobacteria bacterium]
MPVVLARVDQRFIHGQILASGALARRRVNGVIVADKALCGNETVKRIYDRALTMADPPIKNGALYVDPSGMRVLLDGKDARGKRYLALFGDMAAVLAALDGGASFDSLNLGNFCSSSEDKIELYQGFLAGAAEIRELDEIASRVRRIYFGPLDEPDTCYRPCAPAGGSIPAGRRGA